MPINKVLYFGDFFAIPVALALFAFFAFAGQGAAAAGPYAAGALTGLLGWTFAEYWVHRSVYHHAPWLAPLHHRHHEAPKAYIGAPSFLSCGVVIAVAYAPVYWLSPLFADGTASGALVGYAAYMIVHHAAHHWNLAPGHWLYRARVRHMGHHYHDDLHFGVVTGFWDRVFRTDGRRRNRLAGV